MAEEDKLREVMLKDLELQWDDHFPFQLEEPQSFFIHLYKDHRDHGQSENYYNHVGKWSPTWGGWSEPAFSIGNLAYLSNGNDLPVV